MKKIKFNSAVIICLLLFSSGILIPENVPGKEEVKRPDSQEIQKKIITLEKISDIYNYDLNQLKKSRSVVEKLRKKADQAIIYKIGVVLFRGFEGVIQKIFETPGPEGLLQEMLFNTEAKPEEKGQFQSWMKRNFLRRKELRKTCVLLEQVLKTPLNRFDDERESFPYTEDLWKTPDGKPDTYLMKLTRRLNVIVFISLELSNQIGLSMEEILKDGREVENMIKSLKSELKPVEIPSEAEKVKNGDQSRT